MKLLACISICFLLSLLPALISCAQEPEIADSPEARTQRAQELARFEIENGVLANTLDQGASLALDYSLDALKLELGRELTAEEKLRARQILREALGDVFTPQRWEENLVNVYSKHFTALELDQFLVFLRSPLGLKVLEVQPKIDSEVSAGGEAILDARLDEFRQAVDRALAAEFGEAGKEGEAE